MRCTFLLALVFLAVSLTPAWGQVAAPQLIPASGGVADPTFTKDPTIVPTNPAVLAWGVPTRVVAGVVRAEHDQEKFAITGTGGIDLPQAAVATQYEGTYAGGVFAGERYGLAVQTITLQSVTDNSLDDTHTSIGGGVAVSDNVAVGAGYHLNNEIQGNNHTHTPGYTAGGSLRLGSLYMGVALGLESASQHAINAQGSDGDSTQTTTAIGVAYVRQGAVRLRAEVWGASLSGHSAKGKGDTTATLQSANFEARAGVFVAGLSFLDAMGNFSISSNNKTALDWKAAEVTLGVVPDHGFAVLYHYAFGDTDAKGKGTFDVGATTVIVQDDVKAYSKAQSLSLVWLY